MKRDLNLAMGHDGARSDPARMWSATTHRASAELETRPPGATAAGIGGGFARDFSAIPVSAHAGSSSPALKRIEGMTRQPPSGGDDVRAISSSGAGTVATTYTPEASDKSTKIVFIQVMRELLDGVPTKPGLIIPAFAYQDKDTTSDFFHVDYVEGEKDPYYNGDDPQDGGTQGNAQSTPKIAASASDAPSLDDASIPAGHTTVDYEFRTAAYSAAGADAGKYYAYADWGFQKQRGKASTTRIGSTSATDPGAKFTNAVKLWNSNHGVSVVGGLVGAGVGALAGAGLGFLVGGPVGAVVGGLIGLAAGGLIGAFR